MRIEPNVMADLAKNGKEAGQPSVPEEMGNNSGPRADGVEEKGDINIKGTGDYMGGTPDAAGK